jgi:hypothetical protein
MPNRAKAKGTSFETAVVNWLQARGVAARRLPLSGARDVGDIEVWDRESELQPWHLEAKNCRTYAFGEWVAEADAEAKNAGRPVAVVAKRNGKGDPGEAFVVMPLRVFAAEVLGATMSTEEATTRDAAG